MKITDEFIMQWGVHKGKKIANVPASYLIWLYENNKVNGSIKEYIKDNLNDLKSERLR